MSKPAVNWHSAVISGFKIAVTLVAHRHPRKLIKYLTADSGKKVEKVFPGLYYISKEICHFQIVVLPQLPVTEYLWLHNLTNALSPNAPLKRIGKIYQLHQESEDYRNFMNTLIRANHLQKGLDKFMCEALYELFADELKERENIGLRQGLSQGLNEGMERISALIQKLLADKRSADIARVTSDPAYRDMLLEQYHL